MSNYNLLATVDQVVHAIARTAYLTANYTGGRQVRTAACEAAEMAFEDWAQSVDLDEDAYQDALTNIQNLIDENLRD